MEEEDSGPLVVLPSSIFLRGGEAFSALAGFSPRFEPCPRWLERADVLPCLGVDLGFVFLASLSGNRVPAEGDDDAPGLGAIALESRANLLKLAENGKVVRDLSFRE